MGLSRRRFLVSSAGASAAALVAGCSNGDGGGKAVATGDTVVASPRYLPFHGIHQTGITSPVPASGLIAALDVVRADRSDLARMLRDLTDEIDGMMAGRAYPATDPRLPALQTGTLGEKPPPTDLSVVVSVGASMFDERFGLGSRKPRELVTMPFMANDKLDPDRSHGDLLLTITADSPDATIFALRQLLRRTRGHLVLRWMVDGFNRRSAPKPGQAQVRNLLGFKDGTANLDASEEGLMDEHVWVGDEDGEPAWALGGSYHVVRIIRMFVERWDRTSLTEQEAVIGREKYTGAPLDGRVETDVPDYDDDPKGKRTPLVAHIRLANPRTRATRKNLILRRGLSYSRGFDGNGNLDQGLAFACFQRSLEDGFMAVQRRLDGEPLEEYIQPQGGGFFFALPGVNRRDGWLGEQLLA
ncbi:MAG: deferrochelatase/peroxidase EfeB [Acidimicrobiia bacterium]|nr:deferrochelatase/peroxidase EfeB [Acidimicrobiia bacterium]